MGLRLGCFPPPFPSLGLDGQMHRVPPDRGGGGGKPRGNPFMFFVYMLTVSHTRISEEIRLSVILIGRLWILDSTNISFRT